MHPLQIQLITLLISSQLNAARLYLAGDSTMAHSPTNNSRNIDGWGAHLQPLLTLPVINRAIGGRSARSFTVDGRFTSIANELSPGDFVVIEFGHNDGGSLSRSDNGRTACPGSGRETCTAASNSGAKVTVQTFPTYLIDAGKLMVSRGAHVVYSSMTPNNIFDSSSGSNNGEYRPSRFTEYARQAARSVSSDGNKASFVDHGLFTAREYQRLGRAKTNQFFANDHTHTSPAGAKVVADAFVKAAGAARCPLGAFVKGVT